MDNFDKSYSNAVVTKVDVLLGFSREFQETTSYFKNHFGRKETVLAGLRLIFGSSPSAAPRARLG
jgi:hypothetical protein